MKTFFDLVQQVQKPGLCHHCGGCVTFCTAINFGALKQDPEGKPVYADMEKCIECGICYMICPEIGELEEETRERLDWSLPMGKVLETTVARSRDASVLKRATDGGAVTTLLLALFDAGRIDGAIVTRKKGPFLREPHLATSRREILEAAGFFFDASHGMKIYSETYSTFSAGIQMLGPMTRKGMRRVAFVGTPCQVKTIRKMETLGIVPTDCIKYVLGLFCSGNFQFGPDQREQLEKLGGFSWNEVRKVNVKDKLMIHLDSGQVMEIDMDELSFMKRYACRFCDDYSAELADISFGGIGAAEGWTTVITRTPMGRALFAHARSENVLEEYSREKNPRFSSQAAEAVERWSKMKRGRGDKHRSDLEAKAVRVSG